MAYEQKYDRDRVGLRGKLITCEENTVGHLLIADYVDAIKDRLTGLVDSFYAHKNGWERSNQARAQSLVDHQRRIATLEKQLDLALPCWRTVEAATADPVPDKATGTRAIAERCWYDLENSRGYCECKTGLGVGECKYCKRAITRIASAIDEGIKETLGREIEYGNELKVQIEKNHTLTADRDGLLRSLKQVNLNATAERDRLKGEVDGLKSELSECELVEPAGTPIDEADLEQAISDIYDCTNFDPDESYIDAKKAKPILRKLISKCAIAGRPLLAVTEDEIWRIVQLEFSYPEPEDSNKIASAVMTLLRERCAVVPTKGEIEEIVICGAGAFESEKVDAIMLLLTPQTDPKPEDGGDDSAFEKTRLPGGRRQG